jgi:hypothetical protein
VRVQNAERKTLLDRLLAATSPSTPIAVRTPYYKYQLLNRKTTLSTSEAYSGSNVARLGTALARTRTHHTRTRHAHAVGLTWQGGHPGFHNDCFLSSADDLGTYVDPGFEYPYLGNGSQLKRFSFMRGSCAHSVGVCGVAWRVTETKYTTMGGETCAKDTRSSCYAKDGGAALTELARKSLIQLPCACADCVPWCVRCVCKGFHWKYLNIGYNELVINTWKSEGCFSNITQRLGYRLLLSPSATHTYTSAVRPGPSPTGSTY